MSESPSPSELVELVSNALRGPLTGPRRQRFHDRFEDVEDVEDLTPIEIYEAWIGHEPATREDVAKQSEGREAEGFDPAEDPAPNTTRMRVKRVYQRAREAGLDEEAEFLREMGHNTQNEFARFLEEGFLDGDILDQIHDHDPDGGIPRMDGP